jgi:hypothetical protein
MLVAGLALAALELSLTGWAAGLGGVSGSAVQARSRLVLSGSVKGLYPGATAKLRVKVRNRYGFRLRVTSVTVTPKDASKACRKGNVAFARFIGRLLVPAHKVRFVTLKATMARKAPNACKGATFRLAIRGVGVRR